MSELLTIIDRMKFLRDQVLHLNQRDFAARISVSGGLIGQIETGKIGVSPKLLRTLEERFNVKLTFGNSPATRQGVGHE